MSSSDKPQAKPGTLTITNTVCHQVTVDFGVQADGTREILVIPAARINRMKETAPGRLRGVAAETWAKVKAHGTAGKLVKKGLLLAALED